MPKYSVNVAERFAYVAVYDVEAEDEYEAEDKARAIHDEWCENGGLEEAQENAEWTDTDVYDPVEVD